MLRIQIQKCHAQVSGSENDIDMDPDPHPAGWKSVTNTLPFQVHSKTIIPDGNPYLYAQNMEILVGELL